jgi:PKD repeat protein
VIRDWDTKTVPDGTYGLVATAFDAEGRRGHLHGRDLHRQRPRVMISAPSDGAEVRGFVALEARTSGLFPAAGVTFDVNGTGLIASEVTPGRWRAVWDANSFPEGSYSITATATNFAAEVASDSVGVNLVATSGQAFFDFDWSNCTLLTCSFLDSSGAGTWSWNFGDGNTSAEQNPTHTYSTYGIYTVTLTAGGTSYSRVIPVGNIGIDGFNTNPINDAGTEFITWTSAVKDFAYEVGTVIAVPAMWKTTVGSTEFAVLPEAVLFTPEEADGTDPELVGVADDGVLFTITFTEVQYRGGTGIFKGKVNLRLPVEIDYESDGNVDWVAQLGTNVDVTNTALEDTGDFLNVWVVAPEAGDLVSGIVEIRAAPEASVTVDEIEFFVNGTSIGTDTDGSDGWTIDWDTTELANGDYALAAVARGGGLVATSSEILVTVNNSGQPQPTVTLTADPETVALNGSSNLTWSSTNATSCEASGGWSGPRAASGSESTGALTATTTYTLSCTGPGGAAHASVTVTVVPEPTVMLTADPLTIVEGEPSTLTWSSTNATSCEAPSWTTSTDPNGSQQVSPTETTIYTITCTGLSGTAEASVTVTVEQLPDEITFTGFSAPGARGTWSATISVTGGPPNTTISGTWNIGGTPNSCTTDGSGACSFTLSGIRNNITSVTWTYTSSGQTVTISKP